MELSWSTFLLEIVNFLILVWILQRFLYRPVMAVIARRRAAIEKTLRDAADLNAEAQKLRTSYEGRLADWEEERRRSRQDLRAEIDRERERLTADLRAALEQERQRAQVVEARRLEAAQRKGEEAALEHGARFTARLLAGLAGPALEGLLFDLLLEELAALTPERRAALRPAGEGAPPVEVSSAYPLDAERRRALEEALATLLGAPPAAPEYRRDEALIAGLRIAVGPWVLGANLQDELRAFTELADERA